MSPQGDFDQMNPTRSSSSGGNRAAAGYLRKPGTGWIVVTQYRGGANIEMFLDRGFEPLRKYGDVTQFHGTNEDGKPKRDPAGIWGPILRHKDGPAEFSAEQIITARWYKESDLPVPGVKWPQLRGVQIKEYQCPQCNRAPFVSAIGADGEPLSIGDGTIGLANHLGTSGHQWDRLSLMSYGEKVGIDFNAIGTAVAVVDYAYDEKVQTEPEPEPDFSVEDGLAAQSFVCDCGWDKAKPENPAQSLALHQRMHCPNRQKEPVTA